MSRGVGEVRLVQELFPEWLGLLVALLTQLGDGWVLALLLIGLYVARTHERDGIAVVGGATLAGIGFERGLKTVFGLPRPTESPLGPDHLPQILHPVWELTATASGYGFPSGHATAATIVYVGLAVVLPVGRQRVRFGLAGAVVSLVCFSRVALGVHYLVDVVAGVVLGGVVLSVVFGWPGRLAEHRGSNTFALAIMAALFYMYVSGQAVEAVLLLGMTVGSFGGWQLVVLTRRLVDGRSADRVTVIHGGFALAAVATLFFVFGGLAILVAPVYGGAGTAGLLAAGGVILPIVRHAETADGVGNVTTVWLSAFRMAVRSQIGR